MLVKTYCAAVSGLHALPVTAEINTYRVQGMDAHIQIVGLPDNAVRESTMRIKAALINSGYGFTGDSITVNLSPADVRKEGSGYDLPLAIGILAAMGSLHSNPDLRRYMMMGELGLDGVLRPIKGALPIAIKARELGYEALIVPKENVREAAVVNRLKVYGAENIRQVTDLLDDISPIEPTIVDTRGEFYAHQATFEHDFEDVKGQQQVKRAMEVAAAGGHNLIMIGPPGSGKSMMAKSLPSILPPLTLAESLETTQIYSVAGQLPRGTSLIATRPFRSPHHTISQVALCGGGSNPQPGEISMAHNGVLFLDELPEFSRAALEVLRQPLEDRVINISRAKYSTTFPANFMFVASMNPCPCGYYNDPTRTCTCNEGQIQRYLGKISGPLMDRIDIQCEITPVDINDLTKLPDGEPSAAIRERVIKARQIQADRYRDIPNVHCNAQMTSKLMQQYATPDAPGLDLLRRAMQRLQLSARAYDRILRVARTIADLEASPTIEAHHIAEAVGYRNLDRSTWGRA